MKPKSADGVEGVLIQVGAGVYKFRVYDSEHNFVDYDLHFDFNMILNSNYGFLGPTVASYGFL